jgi:hypothetical protein
MPGKKENPSPLEIADLIDRFIDGNIEPYEWDDFESLGGRTTQLEQIRQRVAAIWAHHPAREGFSEWCSPSGINALRALAAEIRANASNGQE